ncbi:DMT family transporter, partial [uncultured Porphyromonas sp.]|uniref:DMT family transporter n=1 Tax=uncultured Porphyromonas sp. TaxID=159274 RepID=UPI0026202E8D
MRSRWRLHLVMLCVTIIFGINGPFTKALLGGGLTPYTHMFCRFLGATILFWIASIWVPRERIDRKDWGRMTLASLTGIFFNQGLFAIGMSMTSPVNQSLVATLGPIVTMLLAAVVLKEPITRLKGVGVLIGASGALLLVSTNGSSTAGSTLGDLICATATVSYAIYLTSFKTLIQKYHPVTLMKWLFVISLYGSAPLGLRDAMRTEW